MNYPLTSTLAFLASILLGLLGLYEIIKMLNSLDNQEPFDTIHPAWTKEQVKENLKNSKK